MKLISLMMEIKMQLILWSFMSRHRCHSKSLQIVMSFDWPAARSTHIDELRCVWIELSVVSVVYFSSNRWCSFHCLTDVMKNWCGGWRPTLRQHWEAVLHKSICTSDSSAPRGPDNCWAACQYSGFGAKTVENDVGGISSPALQTFLTPY